MVAVYDGVGKSTFDASLSSLAIRGTLALFGAASGPVPPVDPQRLNAAGSVYLTRPLRTHFNRTYDEFAWRAGELFDAISSGAITVTAGERYGLKDAAQAHRDLEGRRTHGSTVLTPWRRALVSGSATRDDMAMPPSKRVLVLGSGFAGLWAALGAARRLDELGAAQGDVDITVISSQPFHDIRVRNYEADLSPCRIPLRELLDPAGIGHITADVTGIDAAAATVSTADGATHGYDRLVLAVGSKVAKPDLPGLAEFAYDVDTYDGAMKLQAHIRGLDVRADPRIRDRGRRRRGSHRHRDR